MRAILILIFLWSTCAFSYNTHEQIDALTIRDKLFDLLHSAYPGCEYKLKKYEGNYDFSDLINVTGTPECAATVNTLKNELDKLKVKLHSELDERIAIKSCKQDIKIRYLAIRPMFSRLSQLASLPNIVNPDAYIRDKLKKVETSTACLAFANKLVPYEAKVAEYNQEIADEEIQKDLLNAAKTILKNADCDKLPQGTAKEKWDKSLCVYVKSTIR